MKLEIDSLPFNSALDEKMFFEWVTRISSITRTHGEGRTIYLEISSRDIPDDDLRELIGLYERYRIEMKPLGAFLNERNRSWFEGNKRSYWHEKIFG